MIRGHGCLRDDERNAGDRKREAGSPPTYGNGDAVTRRPGATCSEPPVDEYVTSYCFDDVPRDVMDRFEAHLVRCESCWTEVQRLEASVRALRLGAVSKDVLLQPEVVGVFNMSGRVDQRFAGNARFAVAVALLHGLLYTASLWTELAYSYDRFSGLLWL